MDDQMVGDNPKSLTANAVKDDIHNSFFHEKDGARKPNEETDGAVKKEMDVNSRTFQKKPIHRFYFVKYPIYDDPQLKLKIDQAEEEVHKRNKAQFQIRQELNMKMHERVMIMYEIKRLTLKDKKLRRILKLKTEDQEPRRKTREKLRRARMINYEKANGLCSSEQELNDLVCSLRHQIQHHSNNLVSENNILREIQEIEGTRENVIAYEKMEAEKEYRWNRYKDFYSNCSSKKSIEDVSKLMDIKRDQIKMDNQATSMKIVLKATEKRIGSLKEAVESLNSLRSEAYGALLELQKQRERANAYDYQNRLVMAKAREHAANKDVTAMEELHKSEVESFMRQWNSSATFRDDYKRRTLRAPNGDG